MSHPVALTLILFALAACGDADPERETPTTDPGAATSPDRPERRTDTLSIEGMAEPLSLRLFRAPDHFPLPFTAYVPEQMVAEPGDEAVRFVAAFGGERNQDAFLHVFVFPPDTDRQAAIAAAKGYKTGRGIPVSQGIEIIADELPPPNLAWALEDFRFRYQSHGQWYAGTIGVGRQADRFFMIVRHYPAEYGDGFPPRADLIQETWRWADGTHLTTPEADPAGR
ncbi:MAG: hypothetical protein ACLFRX_00715 [Gemmatimonadota bacterium]